MLRLAPAIVLAGLMLGQPALAQQAAQPEPPRAGMSKAWGEALIEEREKAAAAAAGKPKPAAGANREVGTGPGRDGKPPQLSESDRICQDARPGLMAAAEKGDAVAAFRVGVIYEEGCGVRRNRQVAAAYYELAAKKDHVEARVRLAAFYVQGDVLGADYAKARALLKEPAAKNHPLAHYHLGVMAWRGDDSKPAKPDPQQAMKHFKAAAEAGLAEAQFIVGQALVEGKDLPKDIKAAAVLLERAARQGYPWAMVILGRLHAEEELPRADPLIAFTWLMIAREGNREDRMLQSATDLSLEKIRDKLDEKKRASAMKQVLDFKPKLEWEEKI
ncbi:MAG: tetratricopeptide repeat protein [Reyranellaceae bacterium]